MKENDRNKTCHICHVNARNRAFLKSRTGLYLKLIKDRVGVAR